MSKALILYYSRTGNTEKLAGALADGCREKGVEVTVKKVQDATPEEALSFDAIIMGSPVYYGSMASECKKFIDDSVRFHGKYAGKVGAAFATSANVGGGNETTVLDIVKAWLIHGMVIAGDSKGDHYGAVSIGSPDKRAIDNARRQGEIIAELLKRLKV